MMVIKSLLLAGFMLASALAGSSDSKPSMAYLQVQSNFDFSLTSQEFRVYYSGLGGYTTSETGSTIKIYKQGSDQEIHSFEVKDKDSKEIYQFALENEKDAAKYEVAVCVDQTCSEKSPALPDIMPADQMDITCKRVTLSGGKLVESASSWQEKFVGPEDGDWISTEDYVNIEAKVNKVLEKAGKDQDYQTDYKRLNLKANPQYKHAGNIFYAALYYDIKRYKKLFDKMPARGAVEGTEYAHEFCERKYLLSAHAHIVDTNTKEVKNRFKTTLFLSEGGKQMYVLGENAEKVHVEMTHEGEEIQEGTYDLWITFCATKKDAIESTYCAKPIIKHNFQVNHNE